MGETSCTIQLMYITWTHLKATTEPCLVLVDTGMGMGMGMGICQLIHSSILYCLLRMWSVTVYTMVVQSGKWATCML